MQAYSAATGTTYESWEALVQAEANGFVAVAILSHGTQVWPWIRGPFESKREAENARARMRNAFKKEQQWRPQVTAKFFVRPAWKTEK